MNAVNLEKSIETLNKTYVGEVEGVHQLDKSKVNELAFLVAMHRVSQAVKNKEITEEDFIKKVTKKRK